MTSSLERLKLYSIYLSQRREGAKLLFVILSLYFQYPYVGKIFFQIFLAKTHRTFGSQTQRKKDIVIPYTIKNYEFFFLLLCVLCASAPLREPLFRGFSTDSCALADLRLYLRFLGVKNYGVKK